MLSQIVHITGAFIGNYSLESKLSKEGMPERQLLIETKSQRKSYSTDRNFRLIIFSDIHNTVVLELIKVGNIIFSCLTSAFFASVSGNKITSFSEINNVELTVCRTSSAFCRF